MLLFPLRLRGLFDDVSVELAIWPIRHIAHHFRVRFAPKLGAGHVHRLVNKHLHFRSRGPKVTANGAQSGLRGGLFRQRLRGGLFQSLMRGGLSQCLGGRGLLLQELNFLLCLCTLALFLVQFLRSLLCLLLCLSKGCLSFSSLDLRCPVSLLFLRSFRFERSNAASLLFGSFLCLLQRHFHALLLLQKAVCFLLSLCYSFLLHSSLLLRGFCLFHSFLCFSLCLLDSILSFPRGLFLGLLDKHRERFPLQLLPSLLSLTLHLTSNFRIFRQPSLSHLRRHRFREQLQILVGQGFWQLLQTLHLLSHLLYRGCSVLGKQTTRLRRLLH
mmetsp:Transcript_64425/g.153705  ORF Transcript_64425/g.153705 Transcript_64425/m.153705 type:complete len:328 (-) Transcript_64425:1223-2206(-)